MATMLNAPNPNVVVQNPLHHPPGFVRLSDLQDETRENITVSGRVVEVTRPVFVCTDGSGDYAMGFTISEGFAMRRVFLFARDHNLLPDIVQNSGITIHGATYSYDSRFGYEVRASPHEGGGWQVWPPGA